MRQLQQTNDGIARLAYCGWRPGYGLQQFDLIVNESGRVFRVQRVQPATTDAFDESGNLVTMTREEVLKTFTVSSPLWVRIGNRMVWGRTHCVLTTVAGQKVGFTGEWDLGMGDTERFVTASRRAFSENFIRIPTAQDRKDWLDLYGAREGLRFPSLEQRRRGFMRPSASEVRRKLPSEWLLPEAAKEDEPESVISRFFTTRPADRAA